MSLIKLSKQTMGFVILTLAGLFSPLSSNSAVIDVSGVKYEDVIDQRGSKLILNGAGVRYKAVFKVYTAGLYLQKKASTTEDVISMLGSKRITLTMLREVDSNELGKLFTRGVEDNTPKSEIGKLIPGLIKMGQIFSDQKIWLLVTPSWSSGYQALVASFLPKENRKVNLSRNQSFITHYCEFG